jgi:hypothetical protein
MHARWPYVLLCLVPLLVPNGAPAATVILQPDPDQTSSSGTLLYRAAAGEQNVLTTRVELVDGQEVWTLSETGAVIAAPAPCSTLDIHTVRCASERYINLVDVDLGDGDDRFESSSSGGEERFGNVIARGGDGNDTMRLANSHNTVFGGAGNDVLTVSGHVEGNHLNGGPGDDRLFGSQSFDKLNGGGGRDALYGRGGDDIMTDGDRDGVAGSAGPGPDLFVGGGKSECCLIVPGDRVTYRGRSERLFVDLADDKPDGEAGEGDVLVGVESVEGGHAADRLLGDGHRNSLIGRGGDDVLVGRGRDDRLTPGRGDDRISCGAGSADIAGPTDVGDRLGGGCEMLDASDIGIYPLTVRPRRADGAFVYAVTCPEAHADSAALYARCIPTVHLREALGAHRLLGVGSLPWGRWATEDVHVRITALGRRLTTRRRGVLTTIRLGIRLRDEGETFTRTARWTTRLRD